MSAAGVAPAPTPPAPTARAGRPLRIEMVLPSLAPAGMEMVTVALAEALLARGHEVGFTCFHDHGPTGAPLRERVAALGMPHVVVPVPGLSALVRAAPALVAHFRARRPDVVHAHTGVWPKAARAARAAGVPVVVHTAHGFKAEEPWFADLLMRVAARETDAIVAVADAVADRMVRGARIPRARIARIVNGLDTVRFAPGVGRGVLRARLGIPADVPVIGSVARYDPVKNLALLVNAFARVRARHPHARLVLVGEGPERAALEALIAERGLGDAVTLAGVLAEPTEAYGALDVFVLPSRSEGTSMSLLEAMASGVPVVATAVGGNPALVEDRRDGRLVPTEDEPALAAAITALLDAPDAAAAMARSARARVEREFSQAAMVDAYEACYREACRAAGLVVDAPLP